MNYRDIVTAAQAYMTEYDEESFVSTPGNACLHYARWWRSKINNALRAGGQSVRALNCDC